MSIPAPVVLLDARGKYIHPAFMVGRSSAKSAVAENGVLGNLPINAVPWDYSANSGFACSLEPQTVNLLPYSNEFSGWSQSRVVATAGAAPGPDGKLSLNRLQEDTADGGHYISAVASMAAGADVCYSAVLKAGERTRARLSVYPEGEYGERVDVDVDLTDGSLSEPVSAGTGTILATGRESLGNGIYRVWIAANFGAGVTNVRSRVMLLGGSADSYPGDGASGIYAGFAQIEEGPIPTSYIATEGSTSLRAADRMWIAASDHPSWWNATAGTLVLAYEQRFKIDRTLNRYLVEIGDGSASSTGWIQVRNPAGFDYLRVYGSSFAGSAQNIATGEAVLGRHILALAWDHRERAIALNGSIVLQNQLDAPPPLAMEFGFGSASGSSVKQGRHRVERASYYPQRLSNADLQSLTAIQE